MKNNKLSERAQAELLATVKLWDESKAARVAAHEAQNNAAALEAAYQEQRGQFMRSVNWDKYKDCLLEHVILPDGRLCVVEANALYVYDAERLTDLSEREGNVMLRAVTRLEAVLMEKYGADYSFHITGRGHTLAQRNIKGKTQIPPVRPES